jgi:hypothetical protein
MRKLFCNICAIMMMILLSGCITPSVKESVISNLPDKLIYIAGQDMELDLTGGEVTLIMETFLKPDSLEIHSMDGHFIPPRLLYEINFNIPNVYVIEVFLGPPGKRATFEIQVVTQEQYDAMMAQGE